MLLLTITEIWAAAIVSIVHVQVIHLLNTLLDTAFIASRGGWLYCDDSSVKPADVKQVVVSPYLFMPLVG